MKVNEILTEAWSQKYKSSINCSHPKGFSQRAHCAGKKKHNESMEMEMVCEDCGMCQTHGDHMMEVKQRLDAKCWKGKHKEGTKIKGGVRVNNCVPNESTELEEEFDLIESIIERLAEHNGVDAEVIWEDLESLTEDELYAFAVTSEPIMESYQKGEYGRVLDALQLYYPRVSMEELNVPGYHRVIANKANVPVEYAAQVINDFVRADEPDDDDDDDWGNVVEQGVAEGGDDKRQWSNKDMERLRRAETELDDIFGTPDDSWTKTKQSQIKHRIKTKPMAGPKGVLPEQGLAESEAWQKANNRDRTDGMSRKAVKTYRREHPGSKLQTAVTTKPSKLKKGSKASKRRKSYCSRSRGQMKMHNISCAKTPDKAICKARRRWNC